MRLVSSCVSLLRSKGLLQSHGPLYFAQVDGLIETLRCFYQFKVLSFGTRYSLFPGVGFTITRESCELWSSIRMSSVLFRLYEIVLCDALA